MRCPKCGYISFDRQRSCGKCSNDLTAVSEQLQGTVSKAATPFFLGAALGQQNPSPTESFPDFHEEEETLTLDELEADASPTDADDLDFAGAPLDEDDLEAQPLPSLGLEDIDVSDLVPPEEEEEELVLHIGNEQQETILSPASPQEEEDSLTGIEFSSLEPDDLLSTGEQETPPAGAEDDEIIDLSSLMDSGAPPVKSKDSGGEDLDILDLSLDDTPEELRLGLEDDEPAPAPADEAKKPASTVADIPDLGLTLENDDH
jgi:hypothetical protein